MRIDILMGLEEMDFRECRQRREVENFENMSVNVILISDLIENKERTARPQDLIDAANLRRELSKSKPN